MTPSIVPPKTRQRIHRLWDALPDYGAARMEEALNHALRELAALVGAQQAYWLGTVRLSYKRDVLNGWRSVAIHYLHPRPALAKRYQRHRRLLKAGKVDASMLGARKGAGFRINIQNEYMPKSWHTSEFYAAFIAPLKIHDVIYMIMPIGEDAESWFGFQRIGAQRKDFTPAERAVIEYANQPLQWFHRLIALHYGLNIANAPLTATERRVLAALLGDGTESAIAKQLKLTPATVHTYAKRIYRKLRVRGRAGLAALWLMR